MIAKLLTLLSAAAVAVPAVATAQQATVPPQISSQDGITQGRSETGGQSYGDRNRGGRSGFYSYPRHRHVDDSNGGLERRPFSSLSAGTSPYCDNCHGSAYYGPDYGAPYFGGGYYDRGVYYRDPWAGSRQ